MWSIDVNQAGKELSGQKLVKHLAELARLSHPEKKSMLNSGFWPNYSVSLGYQAAQTHLVCLTAKKTFPR